MTAPAARIDVRPYACPLTWVKTRIALDRIREGDVLEVLLREGEPLESLPRSAGDEGHRVVGIEALAAGAPGDFRLLIEKGAAAPGLLP